MNGGSGGDSFWTAGEAFMEAEDERRRKGMFDGVIRLEGGTLLLTGGLLVDHNA